MLPVARGEEVTPTWYDIGDALLIHMQPNFVPGRRYGVCTMLVPGAGRASVAQRHGGGRPAVEAGAGAGGQAVQHQCSGVLRKLDRR